MFVDRQAMTSNDELARVASAMLDSFADKQVEVIQCPYNGIPQGLVNACKAIARAWCMQVENIMPMVYNLTDGRFESQPPVESPIQAVSVTQETAILALIAPKTKARGEIRADRVAGDRSILTVTYRKSTPEVGESWAWLRTKLETQGLIDAQPAHVGSAPARTEALANLRQNLAEHFNKDELRTLCFDMGIKHENLPADTLDGMARELVACCERTGKIPELVAQCRKRHPKVSWE